MRKELFYFNNKDNVTLKQALKEVGVCEGIKVRYLNEGIEIIASYGDEE